MPNILSELLSSAAALGTYNQVLQVTQNNVANASTPGYVKQRQNLIAMPFDPVSGAMGGVRAGTIESARNLYAEQAVRRQTVLLGQAQQNVNSFSSLQSLFDISGKSGLPSTLNHLFQSFSAWAQSPGDATARQTVLERAGDVARSFQQAATGLSDLAQGTERQIGQTVQQVNALTRQIADYNAQILKTGGADAGLDTGLTSTLEQLSELVDVTALKQADGSVTVLLDGQVPLVDGDLQHGVSFRFVSPDTPPPVYPDARPQAAIFAEDGADITPRATGGQLGALLDVRNRVLPSYLGDAWHAGDLNDMAKQFADRVNGLLTSGVASAGPPPVAGVPLFQYDTGHGTSTAATLEVDLGVTPDQLAAADAGPPPVSNGIPLALARLASPESDADRINGASFNQFYAAMAARAGVQLNRASSDVSVQQSMVAQTKELRQQMSGVSLDEEATILIQFQRAYEATSRLITVLNQLAQDTINMLN